MGLDKKILKRIISTKTKKGHTVLHRAAKNLDCERVPMELLKFITRNYKNPEGKFHV
jgi:hypothetical protein